MMIREAIMANCKMSWSGMITNAISFYNQTAFNHDRNRITKEQNTLRYNDEDCKSRCKSLLYRSTT
jgi:hypothetical protein